MVKRYCFILALTYAVLTLSSCSPINILDGAQIKGEENYFMVSNSLNSIDTDSENKEYKCEMRGLQTVQGGSPTSKNSTTSNSNSAGVVATPDSSKRWKSLLSYNERVLYEKMLAMKNSFQASLEFLPDGFHPERPEYRTQVEYIIGIFIGAAAIFTFLIILYLILRFGFKKCVGPTKVSQVDRLYRNSTWLIMIASLISLIFVYSFLLTYSFSINNAINDVASNVEGQYDLIKSNSIPSFTNITNIINNANITGLPQVVFDSTFKTMLQNNSDVAISRMKTLLTFENSRSLTTGLIFVFYLLICGLSFFAFFKHKPNLVLFLSIVLLVSLPFLLFFQGITASFYFIYSDTCQAVHDAIYENQFPVHNFGLGYYVSCASRQTRSGLYSFSYQLDNVSNELARRLTLNNTSEAESATYLQLQSSIKSEKTGPIASLMNCDLVYSSVSYMEQRFCANGMKWTNYLITSYSWLILIIFFCAIAINRLKPIVEKKRSEIESMLENVEYE